MLSLATLAILVAAASNLLAIEIGNSASNGIQIRQMQDSQTQALRNQIQREQFQQQQQQFRAQDRQIGSPPVMQVPKVKPTCQNSIYGSSYLKTCR